MIACCLFCCAPSARAACSNFTSSDPGSYFLDGVQANIEYKKGLSLDAYAPRGKSRPAALLIHGRSGDKSTHLTQLFPLLANAGYAWFSVNYHNLADLRAAISFIECPGRFQIEPRLFLIGEDTGLSMALELATQSGSSAGFRKVIGFGAVNALVDTPDPHLPVVLFQGTADEDADPKHLERACKNWTNCRFESIPLGIHNLENWRPDEWEWKEEFTAILRNGRKGLWKDIVYSRPGGLPLTMNANLPEGRGPFPAVIVVHGGGWEAGDKLTYVSPVLLLLSREKFAWFSIDYRLTPFVRNEEQLEDLRNAIRYVRVHAARFNVDPKAIAVLGESAGGQIVTEVASKACSGCEVQAVVSFYGVYDFERWAADANWRPILDRVFGSWNAGTLRSYSPISHVHLGMPPVLLLQGTNDELYPGTLAYERQLKKERVNHELIVLKDAPHGMENWVGHPEWEVYRPKLVAWLLSVLY